MTPSSALLLIADQGSCREVGNPEAWHPDREVGWAVIAPIRVCVECPVQQTCLSYAIEVGATGIWGATTTQQRHRLAAARARAKTRSEGA